MLLFIVDPEMQLMIDTHISKGHAEFSVLLLVSVVHLFQLMKDITKFTLYLCPLSDMYHISVIF